MFDPIYHLSICLGFAACFAVGCSTATQAQRPRTPATTRSVNEVKLSDAEPLNHLQSDDVQINLTDKLTSPQVNQTVFFGEVDGINPTDDQSIIAAIPMIALHAGSDWKAVQLMGPGLLDAGWRYVGAGPRPHEVWGVLDTAAGESRSNFVMAHSTDGANTFSLTVFHKPCRLAIISDFAMSRAGVGRVTLSLDTDCGLTKAGLYHYETTDHGITWSRTPRYEPDAMIRADAVTSDEQPDPITPAARTLFSHTVLRKSANHK